MDLELALIQLKHDMEELAEQYDSAASNERLWAKGSPDSETAQMHEKNAEHNSDMAEFYRSLAGKSLDLIDSYQEEDVFPYGLGFSEDSEEEYYDETYHDYSEDELRKMGCFDNLNEEDE